MHICSVIIYPLQKKFIGTSSIMARGKCRVLPTDSICQVVTGTAVIFHLAGRQDRQYVSPWNIIYNALSQFRTYFLHTIECSGYLPYLNLPYIQATDCDCNLIRAFEAFISLRNQSAKHPDSGCFDISGVVIGSALSKGWRSGPVAFLAGHFQRLDRNRKPRMKSFWHQGYRRIGFRTVFSAIYFPQ